MDLLTKYKEIQIKSEVKNNFDLKYMGLGLGGEVGEILNEIKKLERDDNNTLTEERRKKIILEMGDMMWYLQGICNRLNTSITEVIESNINKVSK
jgi:NTP pyrophosphatase (non-canonical NTP hydrolase)|tara:strand:+ start:903 stop:1187 length:285 start_codon:yes stop_codon:yes gene_type:complete